MGRKKARESSMTFVYQVEINDSTADTIEEYLNRRKYTEEEASYIKEATNSIMENKEVIDEKIQEHSQSWKVERMSKVDLAILRVAVNEIMFMDIPVKVSINEAVEMSKKFSNPESSKFINGILGALVRSEEK